MNYKNIADRIVKQGIGVVTIVYDSHMRADFVYKLQGWNYSTNAEQFCHDPRVAMALMEKCANLEMYHDGRYVCMVTVPETSRINEHSDKSLSFAIVKASLEALENE